MFLEQIFIKHPFVPGSDCKVLNKTNIALVPHLLELMLMRKKTYSKIASIPTHMTADCAVVKEKKFFEKSIWALGEAWSTSGCVIWEGYFKGMAV